jgi:hypothetical protein
MLKSLSVVGGEVIIRDWVGVIIATYKTLKEFGDVTLNDKHNY